MFNCLLETRPFQNGAALQVTAFYQKINGPPQLFKCKRNRSPFLHKCSQHSEEAVSNEHF